MSKQAQPQYDSDKMALLLKKQQNAIVKDSKQTAAALCYYYHMTLEEASEIPYGDAQLLIKAARVFKAQDTLQQIAAITAALSGNKANKLIKQLEKEAKW